MADPQRMGILEEWAREAGISLLTLLERFREMAMRQSPVKQRLSGMNMQVLRILHVMFFGTESSLKSVDELSDLLVPIYEADPEDATLIENLSKKDKTRLRAMVSILSGHRPDSRKKKAELINAIVSLYRSRLR